MANVSFEITRQIGVLSERRTGWKKELNLVAWNGAEPKYDIREWSEDHSMMSRGITLTKEEMAVLLESMKDERR